jgi:hypothetical protein
MRCQGLKSTFANQFRQARSHPSNSSTQQQPRPKYGLTYPRAFLYLRLRLCIFHTMILGQVSWLDCFVFLLFLAPQLIYHVGFFRTLICGMRALPFLCMLSP